MKDQPTHLPVQPDAQTYQICVRGLLDAGWATRLNVTNLTHIADGTTLLSGTVADQAALHGLLQRVRDIGIPLVSVVCIDQAARPSITPDADQGNAR